MHGRRDFLFEERARSFLAISACGSLAIDRLEGLKAQISSKNQNDRFRKLLIV
jgi:hypothetical protein